MNIAIIIAGGVGSRMKQEIPKQFINVYDKPILIYTLEGFQKDNNFENQTQELINKASLFINEAVVKSKNFIKNIKKGRC